MNIIIKKFNKLKSDIKPFKTAIFSVFIAVMASFGVSVISSFGKQLISKEMYALGMDGMTASAYTSDGQNVTDTHFYTTLAELEDITDISPIIYNPATVTFTNDVSVDVIGWGMNGNAADIISLKVLNGRMINNNDIETKSRICLIDKNIAEKIYKRDNINGKEITVDIAGKTATFTIVGTIEKESNILDTLTGDIVPEFIYIPYSTMCSLFSSDEFNQVIFISSDKTQTVSELKQKLINENYKYRNQTIKLTNLSGQKEQITNITDTAFLSLFAVSCVAVVVCSMAVGSSVNTAVISRQKDIGIKISMGASRVDIAKEFLSAAVMACCAGIFSAFNLMILLMKFISIFLSVDFALDYSLIVFSIFVTIILTIIFSFMPSYNAAKMSPIKALNRE